MDWLCDVVRKVGKIDSIRSSTYRVASIVWPLFAPVTIERTIAETPIKFRLQTPSDFEVIINDIDVERETITKFLSVLEHGDVVYDIGSNIGTYGILAHNELSKCTVVAFEPLPENVSRLRDNIDANKAAVEIYQVALSNSTGSADFIANHSKTGRLIEGDAMEPSITVEKTGGDIFTEQLSVMPTVMKIDVEGEELEVLKSFNKTLSESVRELFVEIHEQNYGNVGLSKAEVAELRQYLQQKGFQLTQTDETAMTRTIHASRE